MAAASRRKASRSNWGARIFAVLGSAAAFVGFWQMAAHAPHPNSATPAATPADSYTIPGAGDNPIPLPSAPHSATGLSH